MIQLFVAGRFAGTMAESDRVIREAAASYHQVEYRLPDGRPLGTFTPVPFDEPDYRPPAQKHYPTGEFLTFEELKKRLGWE